MCPTEQPVFCEFQYSSKQNDSLLVMFGVSHRTSHLDSDVAMAKALMHEPKIKTRLRRLSGGLLKKVNNFLGLCALTLCFSFMKCRPVSWQLLDMETGDHIGNL